MTDEKKKLSKGGPGTPTTWYDMYLEIESKLTGRIFDLERKVKALEQRLERVDNRTFRFERIGGLNE